MYVALCKLYLFLGLRAHSNAVKLVLKCSPVAFLGVVVALRVLNTRAPVTSMGPGSAGKLSQLFWGLLFSCIGDGYLVFPEYFLFGVAAFTIAQAIYVTLFSGRLVVLMDLSTEEVVAALGVAVVSALLFAAVMRKMGSRMLLPAAIYAVLISMMLWSALVQANRNLSQLTLLGAVGALMFYLSDMLLIVNKWSVSVPFANVFIMATYYAGQLLITSSVLGIN